MSTQPPTDASRVSTEGSGHARGRIEFGPPPALADALREPMQLQRGLFASSRDAHPEPDPQERRAAACGPCEIVVATSFPAFSEGLVGWLEDAAAQWRVTATCVSGPELLAAVTVTPTAVIVATDEIGPPDLFGEIRAHVPGSRILVLASVQSPAAEALLVRSGVSAVIPASSSRRETLRSVMALLGGQAIVSAEALRLIVAPPSEPGPALTARQREVLELLAQGQTTSQIAEHLVVTPSTVKTHFKQIGERLGVPGGQRGLTASAHCLLEHGGVVHGAGPQPAGVVSQTM